MRLIGCVTYVTIDQPQGTKYGTLMYVGNEDF